MTRWAGRILLFLGTLHLVVLGAQNTQYFDDWFTGGLWNLPREEFIHPGGAAGAFWASFGSFAVPLMVLGALVLGLARRGVTVPPFVGWTLGAWGLVGAVIMEPTPMILMLVPAFLLIRAGRDHQDHEDRQDHHARQDREDRQDHSARLDHQDRLDHQERPRSSR
ncbi:DUF6463 family protein [Streptomyces sp. NPDC003042]